MRDRHGWIYFTILESPKNLICSAQEGDIPVINRKILLHAASLLEFEGPTDAAVWRHKHVSEVTFRCVCVWPRRGCTFIFNTPYSSYWIKRHSKTQTSDVIMFYMNVIWVEALSHTHTHKHIYTQRECSWSILKNRVFYRLFNLEAGFLYTM